MIYSAKTKLAAARAVMSATTHEERKGVLDHWGVFRSYAPPIMLADQGEVEYVDGVYEILLLTASNWITNHRLKELEARVEELENPNGGRLGDHR